PGGHRPPLARRDEETPPASRRHAGLARRVLDRAIHSLSNAIRGLPHRLLPRVHPRVAAERREHGGTLFLRRGDARRAPQLQPPRRRAQAVLAIVRSIRSTTAKPRRSNSPSAASGSATRVSHSSRWRYSPRWPTGPFHPRTPYGTPPPPSAGR